MSVRSKQLLEGAVAGGPTVFEIGTVPADRTWLIKEVTVRNGHGVTASIRLILVRPSGTLRAYLVEEVGVAAGTTRSYTGRFLVLRAGDIVGLQVNATSGPAGSSQYIISGAELLGVA